MLDYDQSLKGRYTRQINLSLGLKIYFNEILYILQDSGESVSGKLSYSGFRNVTWTDCND